MDANCAPPMRRNLRCSKLNTGFKILCLNTEFQILCLNSYNPDPTTFFLLLLPSAPLSALSLSLCKWFVFDVMWCAVLCFVVLLCCAIIWCDIFCAVLYYCVMWCFLCVILCKIYFCVLICDVMWCDVIYLLVWSYFVACFLFISKFYIVHSYFKII